MPAERYIDIDGLRARCLFAGETGPSVVLIHGLGASAEIWTSSIGPLASRHRVFAPDLKNMSCFGCGWNREIRQSRRAITRSSTSRRAPSGSLDINSWIASGEISIRASMETN